MTDNGNYPEQEPPFCKHCGDEIQIDQDGHWIHVMTGCWGCEFGEGSLTASPWGAIYG